MTKSEFPKETQNGSLSNKISAQKNGKFNGFVNPNYAIFPSDDPKKHLKVVTKFIYIGLRKGDLAELLNMLKLTLRIIKVETLVCILPHET